MRRFIDATDWQSVAAATFAIAAVAASARYLHKRRHSGPNALTSRGSKVKPVANGATASQVANVLVDAMRSGSITTYDQCVFVARGSDAKVTRLPLDVFDRVAEAAKAFDIASRIVWNAIAKHHHWICTLESRRRTAFDETIPEHVDALRDLWSTCFPHLSFERRSESWSQLGFQGMDPTTDFRGGGMLALDHFRSFARHHRKQLQAMINFNAQQQADGETSWFLTAVVSIQFTVQLMSQKDHPFSPALLQELYPAEGDDQGGTIDPLAAMHHRLMLHFKTMWEADLPHVMEYNIYMPNVYSTFFAGTASPSVANR